MPYGYNLNVNFLLVLLRLYVLWLHIKSTSFQSCWDKATASMILTSTMGEFICLTQGCNTAPQLDLNPEPLDLVLRTGMTFLLFFVYETMHIMLLKLNTCRVPVQ